MRSTTKLSSLKDITKIYDVFLFDLCGVVHDGIALIQDCVDFIYHLDKLGKSVVFLSNSSKSSIVVSKFLESMGMNISSNWKVMTSGEFFRYRVKNDPSLSIRNNFLNIGENFSYFDGMSMKFVDEVNECDYIIISLVAKSADDLEKWRPKLEEAAAKNIPALCINPDLRAPDGNIEVYTPGYFAHEYKKLGGAVTYFGKPHTPVYDFTLSEYLKKKVPKNKILATGDSLMTDIKGARNFGIDSLLLLRKGIHKNLYCESIEIIQRTCDEFGIYPTYVTDDMSEF